MGYQSQLATTSKCHLMEKLLWEWNWNTFPIIFSIDIVHEHIDSDYHGDFQEPAGGSGRDVFAEQHDMNEGQKVTSAENRKWHRVTMIWKEKWKT